MTTLREAAQQALEALEWYAECSVVIEPAAAAITALRAALEQEPTPPPEARTEAEKTAYAAGWWDALRKAQQAEPVEPVQVADRLARHGISMPGAPK